MPKGNLNKLILVVLLGLCLRAFFLDRFPPSLNWDEVSLGYNAYSILKTGRDEWGSVLPLIFRAFGDFKLPGYIYFLTPVVATLGLTAYSVRLVSVVAGTLSIPLVYILAYRMFKSQKIANMSALLIAISPWGLFLSRMAVEANLACLFLIVAAASLVSADLTMGIVFLGLSAWTYNTFRVFSPLLLLTFIFSPKFRLNIKHYSLIIILFAPVVWQLLSTTGSARFASTSIIDAGAIGRLNELRSHPGGRLVYNKATYFAYNFVINYAKHFLPDYLFFKGTSHYQFSIPGQGLFYLVGLPFLYIGLLLSVKNRRLFLAWVLLAPIGASLTRDVPHTLRSIPLLPLFVIFIAVGVVKSGRVVSAFFVLLCSLSLAIYLHAYTTAYTKDYSWSWQYGHQEMVNFIKQNYDSYDQIVITKKYGEPHEFINFYWPIEPDIYQSDPSKIWDYHAQWYWVDAFAKFRFVNDWEMKAYVNSRDLGKRYLIVSSPDNIGSPNIIKTINFLDSKPAFVISVQ